EERGPGTGRLEQSEEPIGVGLHPALETVPLPTGVSTVGLEDVEPILDVHGEDVFGLLHRSLLPVASSRRLGTGLRGIVAAAPRTPRAGGATSPHSVGGSKAIMRPVGSPGVSGLAPGASGRLRATTWERG